ncbi:DUF1330 domain-containing protein [Microbulbifer flavimaris]|uniref:DUF1330 domain-containing protein n=1 Tax=Microbulbifer flavimaris TaxID=1781068 RepID=A0ABX4HVD9_9GAMM|nr:MULTISPECIES: DUF1330 domain-containing protein [Microbulbifer]KUJ79148.1 hypothetical protein AVO43_15315 [Microbulbifer sp. ZGT114]PCO04070.1 DUF1330 domain-containing protein [Microbulbifer flavimaris]
MLKPLITAVCAFSLSGCIYVSINDTEDLAHSGSCNEPVYLVHSGSIRDTAALQDYQNALSQSVHEQRVPAYMVTEEEPLRLFSGSESATPVSLITRFSCLEQAEEYWASKDNQQLAPLREQAADFQIAVYPLADKVIRF